jgi:hypothetical protein
MDENITSHDVDEKQEVNKQNQPEETPRFLTIWDKFWKRVQKIGLNDFVSKFSTVFY